MKIIVNNSITRFGGAVQVALSLIDEFRKFPENEYHIFSSESIKKSLQLENYPDNFHFYFFNFGVVSLVKTPFISYKLRRLEAKIKPDCIITSSGPSYWKSKAPQLMGYNLPLYIYTDSPYFRRISKYRKLRWILKRFIHLYFFKRDANVLFVQTNDVNKRISQILNIRTYTVTNTFNSFYLNPPTYTAKLPEKKDNEVRLLSLTSYYPHKNLEIIPLVLEELFNKGYHKFKFVVSLKLEDYKKLIPNHLSEFVLNTGPLLPEECPSVYTDCDLLFLPTLAECFSASYPEAMIMHKPIITTNLSFARDICGSAAVYFDATDPVSATEKILLVSNSKKLQDELIQNGIEQVKKFDSSEVRAKKILNICKENYSNFVRP